MCGDLEACRRIMGVVQMRLPLCAAFSVRMSCKLRSALSTVCSTSR